MRWILLLLAALAAPLMPLRAEEPLKGKIVYARKDGERYILHVMNVDGTEDRVLPGQTANVNFFPQWSPDGKRLAFMSGTSLKFEDFQIALINADGTGLRQLATGHKIDAFPAWSPDGKRLAFAGGDAAPGIFLTDAEGNNLEQVNENGTAAVFPFWSADSKSLGYTQLAMIDQKSDIVLKKLDGGAVEKLLAAEKIVFAGPNCLSADGKRLLYTSADETVKQASLRIWSVADKSDTLIEEVKVSDAQTPEEMFMVGAWVGDGKQFLASLRTEKGTGVFLISQDGKTRKRLTPEGVDCMTPAWVGE